MASRYVSWITSEGVDPAVQPEVKPQSDHAAQPGAASLQQGAGPMGSPRAASHGDRLASLDSSIMPGPPRRITAPPSGGLTGERSAGPEPAPAPDSPRRL